MANRKILILENQWVEFNDLCKEISKYSQRNCSFEVVIDTSYSYDQDDNTNNKLAYNLLVTKVRIWIDKNRDSKNDGKEVYRNGILKQISELVGDNQAELIVMDHILGGSYSCLTGIDLAEAMVARILGITNLEDDTIQNISDTGKISKIPPILFLSKTEHTDKKRLDRYEEYQEKMGKMYLKADEKLKEDRDALNRKIEAHTKWVHKGYFGDEILQPEYIKKYVIERGIKELLKKGILEHLEVVITKEERLNGKDTDFHKELVKYRDINYSKWNDSFTKELTNASSDKQYSLTSDGQLYKIVM
jgi:hypothetical protein